MCGIAGIYRSHLAAEARRASVLNMLAAIRYRGPDATGYYFDDHIALGTARLSIIDAVGGQQPISDIAGRFWVVFNGEIYNYKELKQELVRAGCCICSDSDTEVLLHAWIMWGSNSLTRLNGAFAFCIYDRVERTITLARDRFGKRPLYYISDRDGLSFASEMKCFLALDSFRFEFDIDELGSIFRLWTPINAQSGFRGIRQVPAGSYIRATAQAVELFTYAKLTLSSAGQTLTEPEAAAAIRQKLSDSVRLRLRGDVEMGVYLSGGLDSAIVASLMADQAGGPIKSYSVSFDSAEFDESSDQRLVASFLGLDHETLRVGDRDIVDAFPEALWHAEVPVFRTAFVPMFLLSKLVNGCGGKVVLTGEGADEAFLGYDIFKETMLRLAWGSLDELQRATKLRALYPYLRQFSKYDPSALYSLFSRFSRMVPTDFFSHEFRFHNSHLSRRLLNSKQNDLQPLSELARLGGDPYMSLSTIQRAQWLEYKTLLQGYLLSTQGDRMSLAHGVENRCPFLDSDVVDIGCRTNLRFGDGLEDKFLLRKAFASNLPDRILRKAKQPYLAPDASTFLRCRPDYLEQIASPNELKKIGALDAPFCSAFVTKMLTKSYDQVSQAENQAFLFLLSVTFLQRFFVERHARPLSDAEYPFVKQVDGRNLERAPFLTT
jgi:asparagine synthase (glutamine-hydrolysing)